MKRKILALAVLLSTIVAFPVNATIQWANNATSIIADSGGISAGATSMTVSSGHGDRFPAVSSPHYFMCTLVDSSGNREIVKVTARTTSSNTMTIERAQEGTSARAFAAGSLVELRVTKNALDYLSKSADIHEGWYVADASAADQGATTNSRSMASLVASIGSKQATIVLPNTGTGTTTTYTLGTDLTIPVTTTLYIPKGSLISASSGKTLTMNGIVQAGAYQVFTGSGTVTVNTYPQDQVWWGSAQRLDLTSATVSGTFSVGGSGGYPVPTGVMLPYAAGTAPTGWLLCYGQAVSRTTYAALFAIVSTTYGTGDGSTTFNLPDMRGRGFIGLDNLGGSAASRVAAATSLGQAAGAETADISHTHTTGDHTLTVNEIPSHYHAINAYSGGSYGSPSTSTVMTNTGSNTNTTSAGGGLAHNHGNTGTGGSTTQAIMNPYLAGTWIIKY